MVRTHALQHGTLITTASLIHCVRDGHIMLSSSCEFERHIDVLSSSCDSSLWLPNEDFGRMNKRRNPDVRSTFQGREYSIWATNHWNVRRTSGFHLLFILPKSPFGEHKVEFYRHIDMPSSWYHHHVSSTDTSTCYAIFMISILRLVSSSDTSTWNILSSCY